MNVDLIITLLIAVVPSGIIAFAAMQSFKTFFNGQERKALLQMKTDDHKTSFPLKLQAYERLAIFLERIKVHNLVLRVYTPGADAKYMQAEMMKAIRSEFEHNLSQQIYVSPTAWSLVVFAKEETIQMMNLASQTMKEGNGSTDFSNVIFELNKGLEKEPTEQALKFINEEAKKLMA